MAEIDVTHEEGDRYRVHVRDDTGSSEHRVTATESQLRDVGAAGRAEELLEESFRFLLEREPRTAIMSSFELPTISRFFPEYPDEIRRRMS